MNGPGTAGTVTAARPRGLIRPIYLYLKCNGLFEQTTLRAAVTEQQQEEGGKRAETKFVIFFLISAMFDFVVLVIELLTSELGLCLSALL